MLKYWKVIMKLKKFDSINVIPFIDVLLVLLTIVLLTSTFISKGLIPISLPQASSADNLKAKKEIIISIKSSGEIYFDDKKSDIASIKTSIQKLVNTRAIQINCDKKAQFEVFVSILDLLKDQQFSNISIVTKK